MCLILFSYKTHPNYKLVVGANRDEFYERPTAAANFWDDLPDILGGRDLTACGTWMAVNKSGKVSMLTNYRDLSSLKDNAPSRGNLVADFLKTEITAKGYLEKVQLSGQAYNGFNLVLGDIDDLWYYSNHEDKIYQLGSGVYGLSNALLNTSWPKVEKGKSKLELVLDKEVIDPEYIMDILYDDVKSEAGLPDTGVGEEMEKMLSPMFIKSEKYGSRCSTVILVDKDNKMTFTERVFDTKTFESTTSHFELQL